MKTNPDPDDAEISALLRGSRESPALPPRFRENVWRRIEDAAAPAKPASWLEALAGLILRPRFAYAAAAALIFAGALLGGYSGAQSAKQSAQARYVAYVAPNPLR
jgi:hypothetical protein